MPYPAAIVLAILAAPAAAAPPPAPGPLAIPPELTDPGTLGRVLDMTDSLSRALLDIRVGEIEAAAEGRPATRADRRRTVRDVSGLSERELGDEIARARPRAHAAMQAVAHALPAMNDALSRLADEMERAAANMPQPYDPRP